MGSKLPVTKANKDQKVVRQLSRLMTEWTPATGDTETLNGGCKQHYATWKRNLKR